MEDCFDIHSYSSYSNDSHSHSFLYRRCRRRHHGLILFVLMNVITLVRSSSSSLSSTWWTPQFHDSGRFGISSLPPSSMFSSWPSSLSSGWFSSSTMFLRGGAVRQEEEEDGEEEEDYDDDDEGEEEDDPLLSWSSSLLSSSSSSSVWWWDWIRTNLIHHGHGRWKMAQDLVQQEQMVEDYNGQYIATSTSLAQASRHRRLIALPLTNAFDPPMGGFSHGHVQTGDKMSLPNNFVQAIALNKAQVPWLFSVKRIIDHDSTTTKTKTTKDHDLTLSLSTPPRVQFCSGKRTTDNNNNKQEELVDDIITEHIPSNTTLTQVVGGPLDFRAPSLYVFLPHWMMRALGIRPGEIVQVDLITTIPPGTMARLRPHTKQFAKSCSNNPQAVLETELRHYSSLTRGSTIAMEYNHVQYWFDVVDCKTTTTAAAAAATSLGSSSSSRTSVPWIKVQDCDIATEFLPDRETRREQLRQKRQKQREREQERESSSNK